jgi:membrane fusion protein (multidrug efflux system)
VNKTWFVAAVAVALAAAAGVSWKLGVLVLPGATAKDTDKAVAGAQTPGQGGKDAKKPEVPLEFVAREVVRPTLARLPTLIEFSGPLVAPQSAVLRAKTGGTLLALTVTEGQRVAAGQVLGRVELAELNSRVSERNAVVESARAALVQAERTHASNESLAAQQFISPLALENSRSAVDSARAGLNAAKAALDTTQVGLREAMLVAPIAGIVAKRHVLPGEKVSMEQQVLTLVNLVQLELAASVGTHEVSRLQPGMAVEVAVEGVAQPITGRLARIAPAAEPGTRSIGVTVALANPQETLRAGQYALARVVLADETERLTLPEAAVGKTSGQDHVWLIENGALARRAVTLGRRDERQGRVEVLQGVGPQSLVLAARFDNLREGAKATVAGLSAPKGEAERAAAMASAAQGTAPGASPTTLK